MFFFLPRSLKLYRLYHSWPIKLFLRAIILVILILPFFEYPNSISISSDYRYQDIFFKMPQPMCGLTESIELFCLLIFLLDVIVRFRLVGYKRFIQQNWLVAYTLLIVVSFIDLFISVGLCYSLGQSSIGSTLRLRRFFRPLFFVVPSSMMKKFIKSVGRTIRNIVGVFVLLLLHIYVFAMIGMLLFPKTLPAKIIPPSSNNTTDFYDDYNEYFIDDTNGSNHSFHHLTEFTNREGSKYFKSVEDALVSLLVLLTTANNPDIMTPIYQGNRLYFIYFFLFLSIGLYLILNLFTAAVYSGFRGYIEQSMQSSFFRRRVAFRAAFASLSQVSSGVDGACRPLVRQLLHKVKIPKKQLNLMMREVETANRNSPNITWESFKEVFDLYSKGSVKDGTEEIIEYYSKIKIIEWMQRLVRHPMFQYLSILMTLVHVAFLTVEMDIDYELVVKRIDSPLAIANFIFFFYYSFEQLLKIFGLGKRGYFLSFANVFEGFVTLLIVIFELVILSMFHLPFGKGIDREPGRYYTFIQLMNLFIVVRLLRIIPQFKSVSIAFGSMLEILKNLRAFAGIIIVIYYLFALLGMAIFSENHCLEDLTSCNITNHSRIAYIELNYYSYNFHDFAATLVVLWNVMVVNNWFIFLDAFSIATSKWAQIYFIAWWLISVIVTLNLFISLVIEVFVTRWEAYQGKKRNDTAVQDQGFRERFDSVTNFITQSFESHNSIPPAVSDVRLILSNNLVEPSDSDLLHELHRHKELL